MRAFHQCFERYISCGKTPFCVLSPLEKRCGKTPPSPCSSGYPGLWVHPTTAKQEDCVRVTRSSPASCSPDTNQIEPGVRIRRPHRGCALSSQKLSGAQGCREVPATATAKRGATVSLAGRQGRVSVWSAKEAGKYGAGFNDAEHKV